MIATIILSAGASSRMGSPKALCALPSGETFLGKLIRMALAQGTLPVVVVAPPHGPEIRKSFPQAGVVWAWNARPGRGMLSSVQEAIRGLPEAVRGALIWPVDIPLVQDATLRLIADQARTADRLIIPRCQGRGGHPLFVPARLFPQLGSLDPAQGLRRLREDHAQEIDWLDVDDPGILRDFDAPRDL